MEQDIKSAIKLLAKHDYRSTARVVGEYVEKVVAEKLDGELAKHNQPGFDIHTKEFGKIEVKSRAHNSKSKRCTLNHKKMANLDHFLYVEVESGEIAKALMFDISSLKKLASPKGYVYIDESRHGLGTCILEHLN